MSLPAQWTPSQVRRAAREGRLQGPTRGAAPGFVQCNLAVLPAAAAGEFEAWAAANPGVAPILARGEPGDPRLPALGDDLDVRTDLPRYRVFRNGIPVAEPADVRPDWSGDLVAFAFGCSFSLEDALRREGIELRYGERGFGGAIYRTGIETTAVGAFAAPLVVSMRPLSPADAERAVAVSRRYPQLHGAPVHVGDPAGIGVDIERPLDSFGAVDVAPGEVPVFWACGVTPQAAIERARPDLAITHLSAHMLVTDVPIESLDG